MPLTKRRPTQPAAPIQPMRLGFNFRQSISTQIHDCCDQFQQSLQTLSQRLRSFTKKCNTANAQNSSFQASLYRTCSTKTSTISPSYPPPTLYPLKRVRRRAKCIFHSLRHGIAWRQRRKSLPSTSSSSSPLINAPARHSVTDLPSTVSPANRPRPIILKPPGPQVPIDRRALRRSIRAARDLRSQRRRRPHRFYMAHVVPRLARGGSENWSLDGGGDTGAEEVEGWRWHGENERGYVQFYVEPELESVGEELEGELDGGEGRLWG